MSRLTDIEIQEKLSSLYGWEFKDNAIKKTFTFKFYMESIDFINRLAEKAEETNHHPDMVVGWCRIDLAFTSHDQGGVTSACFGMAEIAELLKKE
ncbi:MAG: 4a-hydroxytetrahydrobiopterin dehydratase [Candidatus Marinimicrobia bacterium]|jgi:4a-hydroxytetrahydrobiopterin dehydratase|nr:4a-hydroxytetrahydrobiopterin dehydratase [Candidatus Neomarinimicrobiota bacterium]MBT3617558.1 4a-hydroxytetrahydrobiopterin dehydratase [Candidatus Neomarinimicrobiota bacterium]MBT3829235.1 4a-hydroxytetrahydrobiopterin dehydratase [Candidatus Neomarinimicrobiota bacterium]MBT3996771.1 4a-hydroxytetrahydrobiopterin dehydratase [Candidatus Neomarinimicrobiota bacterium]MBT4280359.1 4a-hydroxytetrahydrobiopterin dehydratase [Candidatus Neomarinimicrobiota bacterium]